MDSATAPADGAKRRSGRFSSDRTQLLIGLAAIAATGLAPLASGNAYWIHTFQLVEVYIAAAIFQNLLFVDAGQKSFGQGAILGLGAYATAILFGLHGVPFALAAVVGVLAATAGGLVYALPALRVQGFHLGFVTMSAAIVFPQLLVSLDRWTNGINGIKVAVPALSEPGVLGVAPLALAVTLLPMAALASHYLIRRSRLGRAMFVAALSPEAARTLGIRPGVMRFVAFVVAAVGTGLAGVLYLPTVAFVSPQGFSIELSFVLFFAVVVGGRGQMLGPIVGIFVVYVLPNVLLARWLEYRLLLYGCLTLAAVMLFPDGIVGSLERLRARRTRSGGGERAFRIDGFLARLGGARAPEAAAAGAAVEVRGGTKRFGAVTALDRVDLTVRRGEVHGLIGANGSGKTSLLNVLSGLSRLDAGSFLIGGVDATRLPADRIARMGLGRTFQAPRIFGQMSLWDNLRVGVDARVGPPDPDLASIAAELEAAFADDSPDLLSHGQRRLVEVMRVVLEETPVVLFDEPAAGLSQSERRNFAELVGFLSRRMGKTVILVEHDLDLVWGIADTITVLDQGRVVASGAPDAVAADPAVQHMFVGSRHARGH